MCAAAAAMGALPIPDSLEKIPLAIPFLMESFTTAKPARPPAICLAPNALCTMVTIAAGIFVMLQIKIISAVTT